ncbi:conserved hypothetical protein [Agrobacterium genomosp. 13 str. CFBP 6927]|uniref:Uncharacterized protein n=1 Tax=Agrobacterium genomosp. 13 str. CFBP 6927 TaxID=1183428 RepID=A0ABM9VHE5_9HYPH|nr:conserved hypothetical protein [Agrobacterium genomosp. 13 str. CFBP 6927]
MAAFSLIYCESLFRFVGGIGVELTVFFRANLAEQVKLSFEEVDMAFLVNQQSFKKLHGDVVSGLGTDITGFLVGGPCVVFAGEIRFQHFLDVLADAQRRQGLKVGMAFEEDNTIDDLVGVLHLFDGFCTLLLCKLGVAPVVQKPVVKPILVYCTEFEKKGLVKPLDDFFVAFQCPLSCSLHGIASGGT